VHTGPGEISQVGFAAGRYGRCGGRVWRDAVRTGRKVGGLEQNVGRLEDGRDVMGCDVYRRRQRIVHVFEHVWRGVALIMDWLVVNNSLDGNKNRTFSAPQHRLYLSVSELNVLIV
jgi:hypothetical protein